MFIIYSYVIQNHEYDDTAYYSDYEENPVCVCQDEETAKKAVEILKEMQEYSNLEFKKFQVAIDEQRSSITNTISANDFIKEYVNNVISNLPDRFRPFESCFLFPNYKYYKFNYFYKKTFIYKVGC